MPSYIATPSLWRTGWRCEGKTEDLGAPPRTPLRGLLSEKPPKNPKNFTAKGNRMVERKNVLRAAVRLPFAVKFRALRARSEEGS